MDTLGNTSALGNYIHFNKSNYETYGTKKAPEEKNSINLTLIYDNLKRYIKNKTAIENGLSNDVLKTLSQRLGLGSSGNTSGNIVLTDSPEFQKNINLVFESLKDKFVQTKKGKTDYRVRSSFNSINNVMKKSVDTNLKESLATAPIVVDGKTIEDSFLKYFEKIGNLIKDGMNVKNKNNKKIVEKIKETLKNLDNALVTKYETIDNVPQWLQNYLTNSKEALKDNTLNLHEQFEALERYRSAVTCYSTYAAFQGIFGERLAALCDDAAYCNALGNIEDFFQSTVTGSQTNSFSITENQVSYFRDVFKTDKNKAISTCYVTQDKVDISINVTPSNQSNATKVFASVKNYTNPTNVLLQDVSFLPVLVALNENINKIDSLNFGNHYLNCLVHKKSILNFNQILDLYIKYIALASGNPLKQESKIANVFIVMSRQKGYVSIFSTQQLLDNINDLNRPHVRINKNLMSSLKQEYVGSKPDEEDAEKRIIKLLQMVRKEHYSVYFDNPAFT